MHVCLSYLKYDTPRFDAHNVHMGDDDSIYYRCMDSTTMKT